MRKKREVSVVGAVHVDGDRASVLVTMQERDDAATLLFDREVAAARLDQTISEASASVAPRRIAWTVALGGEAANHDLVEVPLAVRPFPEARLEACLAVTHWGNADAVAASGYALAHGFDGDTCIVAVAAGESVAEATARVPAPARATTLALAVAALARRVSEDARDPRAGAVLALLCESTSIAAAVLDGGRITFLHQTGMRERLAGSAATSTKRPVELPDELEFELGGSYTPPASTVSRGTERRSTATIEVESDLYQSALLEVVQEILGLYAEIAPAGAALPERILVTGEATARFAARPFLATYLGAQFEVDELDAALAVRIDDPARAREFAAAQSSYAAALALVAAAGCDAGVFLSLDERSGAEGAGSVRSRERRAGRAGIGMRAVLAAVALGACAGTFVGGARLWMAKREAATLAAELRIERDRAARLDAIAAERRDVEAKLAHTRSLLDELNTLRSRQTLPPDLLETIASKLPTDTRLDEISLDRDAVRVAGSTTTRDEVAAFAKSLEELRDAFAEVTPKTETRNVVETDEATGEPVSIARFGFVVTAKYLRVATPPAPKGSGAPSTATPVLEAARR